MTRSIRKSICFTLVLFSSVIVCANENFMKFSDLSEEEQTVYMNANKAQFRIKVSGGSRCTGTYISNEGHGLTAAHCIEKCMPWPGENGLKSWSVDVEANGKKSKHKVVANSWSYPQICEAVIDGEATSIEVLAGAKGRPEEHLPIDVIFYYKQYYFITQEEIDDFKEKWYSAFYNGWGMGGDFAIFKRIETTPKNTSCLKISNADSFKGEYYSLSYPGKTSLNATDVNEDLYLSKGHVYQGNYFNSEAVKIEDSSHRYLNSTLWAFLGSSGASLVNPEDQSIAGVLSAVVGEEGISEDELPDARFVSSKLIREQAGEVLKDISCN